MKSIFTIALMFKAIDQATAPIRKMDEAVGSVGKTLDGAAVKSAGLRSGLDRVGTAAGGLGGVAVRAATRFNQAVDGMIAKTRTLSEKMKETGERAQIGAAATGAGVVKSLSAFKDLEAAQTSLKVAMMGKGGVVNQADYTGMSKLADKLGKDYMGSTEDFYKMFRILTEQGIQVKDILGGTGKAVADFSAVTGEGYNDAALKIAKFQDTFGIASKDMVEFANQASKAKFAFGIDTTEIFYAMPYLGGALKQLNIQGVGASESVLRLMGMMSQAGMPASQIGESLNQLINRMADFDTTLTRNSKKMKKVREELSGTGIQMNFWDENEKFVGFEKMIAEFEKMKGLTEKQRIEVGKAMFGDVGGKAVSILAVKGVAGWKEAEAVIKKQADMTERVGAVQETLAFKWDSFTGTVKTFSAAIGQAINNSTGLKVILDRLNDAFGVMTNWVKEHKTLASVIGISMAATAALTAGVVALGGAVMVGGSILSAYGTGLSAIKFAAGPAAREVKLLILTLRGLNTAQVQRGMFGEIITTAPVAKSRILEVVMAMKAWSVAQLAVFRANLFTISGLRALSITLLTSPIGWIALAIGGAALVIYKYWKPISGFFKGLWQGLKEGLKGLEPAWDIFKRVAPILFPIIIPLKWIFNAIKALFKPLDDVGGKAQNMGVRFGRAIGGILSSVLQLPAKMLAAGANIIDSLFQGMMSKLNKPISAMKGLTQRLRNFLPFSPAKEGALRDINRVRIVETIAESMRPTPLVNAMKGVTAAAMIAASPVTGLAQPSNAPGRPAVATLARPAGHSTGGAMTVTFSPQITIQGGGNAEQIKGQVGEAMKLSFVEFERMMKRYEEQKQRRAF